MGHNLVETRITDEFKESVHKVLNEALKGNETSNYEVPLFTKSGERVMVLLNATTRRNPQGKIVGVVGVGQDITELDQSRSEKEETNLRLQEANQHKSAVYLALENMKDFEIVSWYSESRDAGGKVRPIFTYGINSSLCRDFQVLLYIDKKARSKTFSACRFTFGTGFSFNYWDWPGAEKYLN